MSQECLEAPPAVLHDAVLQPMQQLVWMRIRRFFPPHAVARQTRSGALALSWPLDGHGRRYAALILIRFEDDFLRAMAAGSSARRLAMATEADAMVRAGLRGYDPFAPLPQARVIVVG